MCAVNRLPRTVKTLQKILRNLALRAFSKMRFQSVSVKAFLKTVQMLSSGIPVTAILEMQVTKFLNHQGARRLKSIRRCLVDLPKAGLHRLGLQNNA